MKICYCSGYTPYEPISDVKSIECDDEGYIITFFNESIRRIPFKVGAMIQIVDWANIKEYDHMWKDKNDMFSLSEYISEYTTKEARRNKNAQL